jgi:aldose 1-epimerase
MPILFPVNRIEGGTFTFEGRKYFFPINEPKTNCHLHGILHEQPFKIIEQSQSMVKCIYKANGGDYLQFPHSFEITQTYFLKNDGLYHSVSIRNLSNENMPLFLGFHTTFNSLFLKESKPQNIKVFVDILEGYERNMQVNYLPTGKKPMFDDLSNSLLSGTFNPIKQNASRHYRGNGKMTITDIEKGLRMVYDSDKKFTFRLIYNSADDGYICLEPQTCLANCQNSPFSKEESGFDFLKPSECKTYNSKIYLEEI